MGDAVQDLIPMIGDVKDIRLCLPDHLDDVEDPSPVQEIQAVTGLVEDEQQGGFDHGPGEKDHPFLAVGEAVERLSCDIADPRDEKERRSR